MVVFVLTAIINMRRVLTRPPKKSILLVLLSLIIGPIAFISVSQAQFVRQPMSSLDIRENLFGKLVTGEYPSGTQWAERFNLDGTSDYSENGQAKKGLMRLSGNILCFTYNSDPQQPGGCFEVWQRGKNCFDFYSSDSDASLDQRQFGRSWSARAWKTDQQNTCLSDEIS